jgi:hypothetical protein
VRAIAALLVAAAAIAAAGSAASASRAAFTAGSRNPANTFTTASNFPPALRITAPADGSSVRDTTPTFSGVAGSGSGDSTRVTLRIYSGTSATGTAVQSRNVTRSGGGWSTTLTTALAQGTFTAIATQTDSGGNTGSDTTTFTVDTVVPAPASISAANASGGTKGRLGAGDTLTYRFSEAITPASVLSTFTGGSTTANVQVYLYNYGSTDLLALLDGDGEQNVELDTYVATNADLVTANVTWPATMTQSSDGRSFTITLGAAPSTGVATTVNTAKNMAWTTKAGPADLAGNAITATSTVTETDNDVDF